MSPERRPQRSAATLHAAPASARLVAGALDGALGRLIAERCDAARAEGATRARDHAARALDAACAELDRLREQAATELARDAVELAVEIARTLVRREIQAGRHDIEGMVRESLAASGVGRGTCVVHVHPLDAATLAQVKFRAGTTVEPDEAVARGDAQVSTPHGILVRELPEALRSIHERLLGELA